MIDNTEIARFAYTGQPRSKKNGKEISKNSRTGRSFLRSNKNVEDAECLAAVAIRTQWKSDVKLMCRVNCKFTFYLQCKSTSENTPDLSNLYELPQDALERAGVLANDRKIEGHDGSRRVYLCDDCSERGRYSKGDRKGELKDNCGKSKTCNKAKTEIIITKFNDGIVL
jgi:Holliday junction resolvase RusA-like endonuclease